MKKLAFVRTSKSSYVPNIRIWVIAASLFASASIAHAQTSETASTPGKQHSLSIEVDPAAFILKGYSFSIRYHNKRLPNWSIMASGFAADFPNSMMSEVNRKNGWGDLRFTCSNALFVDYHFKQTGKGLFVGPSVFTYNNKVTNMNTGQAVAFKTIYPNLRVGYTWYPFKNLDLYAAPWLNVGKEFMVGNTNKFAGTAFQLDKFKYILALHIGYKYSFDKLFHNKKKNTSNPI